ncbi:MAG TPA: SpoIIE family protein phosphatase [Bryobacteraceae bacterium]|nr:SpoIIE family protein phosphatase [Bryobacteraceae bacterium]
MTVADSPGLAPPQAKGFRVLVCDDQPDVLEALRLLLKGQGCQAVTVDSPRALLRAARSEKFDLIVADLNYTRDTTSGQEGLDLLASLEAQGNGTPVVVMTAWGSVDLAVEAMRRGACDFIQKPWDNERVISVIRKQADSERRRQSELEIAANVQQKLFPHKPRRLTNLDYAGHCVAAREVGGDYYDFLDISGHTAGFLIADVSGKGVPAALLMANLQACFRSQEPAALLQPAHVLEAVNRHFFDSTAAERFATLFFAIYDDRARKLRYVNCGHLPPILLRASGALETLQPTATMIGAFRRWTCTEQQATMQPGDTLILYSDGVTEAESDSGEDFGQDRLIGSLRANLGQSARSLVQAIIDDVMEFSQGSRYDDITVVALRGI